MLLVWLLLLAAAAFGITALKKQPAPLPSAAIHYSGYAAAATVLGGLLAAFLLSIPVMWAILPIEGIYLTMLIPAAAAIWHCHYLQRKQQRARAGFELLIIFALATATAIAIIATIGIIIAVAVEAADFFSRVNIVDFLFGTVWSPQIAIREDQTAAQGAFGFIPLLAGTLLITAIAMTLATPVGLMIAAYLSEFAADKTRAKIKPILEILAGIPTVVYGFFAITILSPLLVDLGESLGARVAGESALAAGIVMGVMLIPFIASLAEDALFAVPNSLRHGALALGATRYETICQVIFPAAIPGVVAGILLALSRAIGETMIVVMAAGVSATLSINPLEAVTTITVQIVTLLTGDQEFDDVKTLAAFALGLTLFVITLALNLVALKVTRKYQQKYD